MSYILFVNPSILSASGMPFQAVFLATIIASVIGTLVMGLFANVPYAQAPGMGLNAFFTFTVVFGLGYSWQQALAMVFICGVINILITITKIRKLIIHAIPESMQTCHRWWDWDLRCLRWVENANLLKLASAGTMPPLNEALTIVSPSTVDPVTAAVSALKLNRLAFFNPT